MTTHSFQSTTTTPVASDQARLLRILVVVATISTIVVNLLANVVPYNGQTSGEVSDQYKTYFTPAGYVFLIWNVIYMGILAYAIYQARDPVGATPLFRSISGFHILGCIANGVWLFLWHGEWLGASVLVILILLGSLIALYGRMAQAGWEYGRRTRGQTWWVFVPFSLYLGWVSVATIANSSAYLLAAGWTGGGLEPQIWAVILLLIASGLGIYFGYGRRNLAYALVIVWAQVGIGVEQRAAALVAYPAFGLAVMVLIAALLGWRRSGAVQPATLRS